MKRLALTLTTFVLIATACTAGGGGAGGAVSAPPPAPTGGTHTPVTLTVWDYFTERELKNLTQVLDQFHQKYPWITVNVVPGKSFDDIVRGISSGAPIDVAIDQGPDNVAEYCATGGFIDLAPYLQQDHLDLSTIMPDGALRYTQYKGEQCALPLLTDAFGLYYNKDLFAKAGITSPPKTLSELTADAQKLTQRNPDGSIKVVGFDPLSNFYEGYQTYIGNPWGATWYDANGKSAFATDPAWEQVFQWDKQLTDYYGYDNLVRFKADLGGDNSEWNSANGFENGKVAMILDGEWREAFITNDKSTVNYGTAPFPVADDHPELYGSGLIGGTVAGITKNTQHPAEAWLLLKFLTTDTKALETLAEKLRNVPTTYASAKDPVLVNDPIFKTFLDVFANKNSDFRGTSTIGSLDTDLETALLQKWEAGKVTDLATSLSQLADQINRQISLG